MAFKWKDNGKIFMGEGIYHLTWAVVNRVPILGTLEPLSIPDAEGHTAWVRATPLGKAVLAKMNELESRYPEIEIIWKTLMPDHLHAVIWAHEGFEDSIKMVARGYGQGCSKIARKYASVLSVDVAQSDCAMNMDRPATDKHTATKNMDRPATDEHTATKNIDRADTDEQAPTGNSNALDTDSTLSESDPYDCGNGAHTLFSKPFIRTLSRKRQLDRMVKYVKDNPDNAWMRKLHPDLYTIRRNQEYAGLHFDCMGKARLLDYPDTQVIALSRSLCEEQIEAEVQKALRMAEQGVLTYCAAMNDGEKAVTKAIREGGYPLVVMMLDGFPPEGSEAARFFHPGGAYHQACGEGRLYLMAPLADNYSDPRLIERTEAELKRKDEEKGYTHRPLPHSSKRWRMIAGNEMLKMIAGSPPAPALGYAASLIRAEEGGGS